MFSELPDHGMFVTFENEMGKHIKHRKVARQFSLLPTTLLVYSVCLWGKVEMDQL